MRFNRFATLATTLLVTVIALAMQTKALAQSAMDLVAHYVEVLPGADGISYTVRVYLSALDSSGNPLGELTAEGLTIAEDGQKVEVQSLNPIAEEPINLVLVIDTSGSMFGASITDAKAASANFVTTWMTPNDQAAVLTFDDNIRTQINFTNDKKTITDGISRIEAKREAGSCLYDAAYAAVQAVATLRQGSRAVILFTDGRDETLKHALCSVHSPDELIQFASEGETRTPIYTLGLGVTSDRETLKRISDQTGGLHLYASSSSQLANVFQDLAQRLRSQYILTYQSISLPGSHMLTVSMNQPGVEVKDSRKFPLESLPAYISFITPLEGETIHDRLKIEVALATQGETVIEKVAFEVNGVEVGTDPTKPYELELDITQYPIGAMAISAVAYGADNTELARSSPLHLTHAETTENLIPTPEESLPTAALAAPVETSTPMGLAAILLSGLSIILIGALLFFLVRQQKQANLRPLESDEEVGAMPPMPSIPVYHKINENRKAVSSEFESDALGALTVAASDDSSLIGHRFEITTSLITLGRSADNDIMFPNDKPVSRHHAEIYQIGDKLYLRQVETPDASGTAQPPKYGTFLNQVPMESEAALLKTGDEIQLGRRVRLKFESYVRDREGEMPTYDDLTDADDIDRTQEQ
jgi:VWFA-related protein